MNDPVAGGVRITPNDLVPGCHYKIVLPASPQIEDDTALVIYAVYIGVAIWESKLAYFFSMTEGDTTQQLCFSDEELADLFWVGE